MLQCNDVRILCLICRPIYCVSWSKYHLLGMAKTNAELAKDHRERRKAALGAKCQKQETKRVKKYYIPSADLAERKLKLRQEKIITNLRKYRLRQANKKEEEITCLY